MTNTVKFLNAALLSLSSPNIMPKRFYRGRKSHNIGRIHGLEKPEPAQISKKQQGIWNPEKYEAASPNTYDTLNFMVTGYDMVLVENFTKYIHRTMIKYRQDIQEVYALPSNDVEVVKVTSAAQRRVESMERDITLTSHKRVVQVREMKSIALPIILQLLMYHVPQSVHFMVIPHDEEQHAIRFQRKMELEREKEALQRLKDSR